MSIHNERLKSYYNFIENLVIENLAVDIESNKDVEFFFHLDDGPFYEVASLYKEHIYKRHLHLSPDIFLFPFRNRLLESLRLRELQCLVLP